MKGGDFSEKTLWDEFKQPTLFDGAVENYKEYAAGKKTICYNVNVEHSIAVTERFKEEGFSAMHVDAATSKNDRASIFEQFQNGSLQILCNVGIATTGFDEPKVECIIENRATTQLTLHVQMTGRGGRINEGKDHFVVIDMGRNYMRHGLYGEDIDWKGIFHNPKEDKEKKEVERKNLRECKGCAAIIKSDMEKCPYCGCAYTEKEREQHFLDSADVKEIREYKLNHLPADLRKKPGSMNLTELKRYATHMGYNPRWVWVQHNKPWMKNQ